MSWSILTVLVSTLICPEGAIVKDSAPDIFQLLKPFLERKCMKNADFYAFTELQESEKSFHACLSNTPIPKSHEELYKFMCAVIPQKSYECSEELLEKLQPCLDEEESYLPDFLLSAFNGSIEKRCDGNEEAFKAKLEDLKNVECGESDSLYMVLGMADNCIRQLLAEHEHSALDFVIEKSYFCCKLTNVRNCIIDNLNKSCKDNSFPELVASDFEIVLDWCDRNA